MVFDKSWYLRMFYIVAILINKDQTTFIIYCFSNDLAVVRTTIAIFPIHW